MAHLGELKSWQATDVGRVRSQNEDNFLVDRKLKLYVVCDGMGGHAAGEIASQVACAELRQGLLADRERLASYEAGKGHRNDVLQIFEAAVQRACQQVHQIGVEDESKRGMGTTLVALLVLGGRGFIAHVGDSRIYLHRNGSVHQLTEDHSLINELLKRGKLTREQIHKVQYKNAVTRAVGVYESVEADVFDFDILPGDRILLCSDGLHGYLEEAEIPRLFGGIPEEQLVDSLIALANDRGGKDNITAVVVKVPRDEAGDQYAQEVNLKLEVLHRLEFFRNVTYQELVRLLNETTVRPFAAGAHVVLEGDDGDEMFVVLSGKLSVTATGAEIGQLGVGGHFGEMALIERVPRDATVTALEPSRLLVLRRSSIFDLIRKDRDIAVKLLWSYLQVTSRRYRRVSHELLDLKAEVEVLRSPQGR